MLGLRCRDHFRGPTRFRFHLWHIDFTGFQPYAAGGVPLSFFAVEPDVKCRPALMTQLTVAAAGPLDESSMTGPAVPALRSPSLTRLHAPPQRDVTAAAMHDSSAAVDPSPCVIGTRVSVNGTKYLTRFEVVTAGHPPAVLHPNTAVAAAVTGVLLDGAAALTSFWARFVTRLLLYHSLRTAPAPTGVVLPYALLGGRGRLIAA